MIGFVVHAGSRIRIGTRLKSRVWCTALHSDQNDVIIIGGGGRDRSAPPQRRTASSSTGQHSAAGDCDSHYSGRVLCESSLVS